MAKLTFAELIAQGSVQPQIDSVHQAIPDGIPMPISMRDMDYLGTALQLTVPMDLPMADACPICKGFTMDTGAYACFGFCYQCYRIGEDQMLAELAGVQD